MVICMYTGMCTCDSCLHHLQAFSCHPSVSPTPALSTHTSTSKFSLLDFPIRGIIEQRPVLTGFFLYVMVLTPITNGLTTDYLGILSSHPWVSVHLLCHISALPSRLLLLCFDIEKCGPPTAFFFFRIVLACGSLASP